MAVFVADNVKTWLDGYDVSGDLSKLGLMYAAELKDNTVFGNTTRSRVPGLKTSKLTLDGYWQSADTPQLIDKTLFERIAVSNSLCSVSPDGGAEGDVGFTFRVTAGDYTPGAKVGDLLAFVVNAEGSDGIGLLRGTVMNNATRSTTGTGTARQLGAVAAGKSLYASLHVLGVTGTLPTLVVKVQSDNLVGFGSPADVITFASANAISSQWGTPVAGALTDDWWRISWTLGGTLPTFQFVVVVAIQ